MKIKRLVSLLLITIMCLGVFAFPVGADSYNSDDTNALYTLGILDSSTVDLARPVTRIEMVKYAVRLFGKDITLANEATPFADVAAEHEASGAVNFAIAKNIISPSDMFYPDRTVRYEEAVKMIVSALEYNDYANKSGGYPNGYLSVAYEIGLLKDITAGGGDGLTLKTVAKLLSNALNSAVCNPTLVVNMSGKELIVSDISAKDTVLNKRFKISKYGALITEYNEAEGIVKVEIKSKDKKDESAIYNVGATPVFAVSEGASIGDIEYTLADIYVNDSDELVFVKVDKNIEVIAGYIYEVNESHNNAGHYPSYVKNIGFEDTEEYFDIADNCKMFFNAEAVDVNTSYPFVGAFARAVIYRDEVIALEAWDLTEGGITTSVSDDEIRYSKGEGSIRSLPEISEYKDVSVFINGSKSALWKLADDTLFDWFATDDKDTLIIVASTRAITDEFTSKTSSKLNIGGDAYPISEKYNLYVSIDGHNYRLSADVNDLFNRTVTAYIDSAGYIRYLRPAIDNEVYTEYYSFIFGYNQVGLEAPKLKVYLINNGTVTEEVYPLTEKAAEKQAVILENIKSQVSTLKSATGSGRNDALKESDLLYRIRVNKNNEIISIREATLFSEPSLDAFYESGQNGYSVSKFTSLRTVYTDEPRVYFDTADILVLYYSEAAGLTAKIIDWETIRYTSGDSLFLTPYAQPGSSDVDLMLIRGDLETYSKDSNANSGLLTDISTVYDVETEREVTSVIVNGVEYMVSKYKNVLAEIDNAAYINFQTGNPFLPTKEIKINSITNLSGDPENWEVVEGTADGMHRAEVEKIDEKRVTLKNGEVWYMLSSVPVYQLVGEGNKIRFVSQDRTRIDEGQEIWYIFDGEVRVVFYR